MEVPHAQNIAYNLQGRRTSGRCAAVGIQPEWAVDGSLRVVLWDVSLSRAFVT